MNRRTFLVTTGTAAIGGIAGCLAGESEEGYEMQEFQGEDVPLAPIDDVYDWYEEDSTRFVDARGAGQYEAARIEGAVLSSAPDGVQNDPVEEWPTDQRIVTYCGCPHHLSGQRAGSLIGDGYESVYALDEGFQEWIDRGYPLEGNEVVGDIPAYDIRGRSDPAYAGQYVWVSDLEREQYEIAPIDEDGGYEMTLHFTGLDDDDLLTVEAPDYTVEAPLSELTESVVTPPEN